MGNEPSIIERQALGNLIKVLESKNVELERYYSNSFEEWNPIFDSGISGYDYYKTLKDFPLYAKRCIIQTALVGWRWHRDLHTLYDTINTLIYLDICGPAEYYFMQILYNIINRFGNELGDIPFIEIESYKVTDYTVRFWKDELGSYGGGTYGIVDFQLHDARVEPVLAVVPWNSVLRNVFHIASDDEDNELDEYDIEDVTSQLYGLFKEEWVKTHCPWIQSDWDFQYQKEKMGRGIVYILHSLKYYNSNGV